ncbi:MAG TPA: class I SAM-dependent methyltransferase [Gemmatimonadaceae bacterium]|nr:class I SAM-dependent methyltransferase [Gemmatimonadaceae bacterium]
MKGELHLPLPGRLSATGPVDFVEQYYSGAAGYMLRQRLRWVRDELPRCESVLEIGYGSGIFFYELARHARTVIGVDVHRSGADVVKYCSADRLTVNVAQASGMSLPFADGSFDAVVIVSALEFMSDPELCLHEAVRVTRSGGRVLAVIPRIHAWADAVWRVISGADPEADFQGGRERVDQALADPTLWVTRDPRPRHLPRAIAPYDLVTLRPNRRVTQKPLGRTGSNVYVDRRRLVYAQSAYGNRKRQSPALT